MRFIYGVVLALTISLTSQGQVTMTATDSVMFARYNDEHMGKCFEGLTRSARLDSLEKKLGFHFCSIAACVNPFSVAYFKGEDRELIKCRLEEIAERFFNNGTPVMLVLGGLSGGDDANKMNAERNAYNLKYVSTGNYCSVSETEHYFEYAFNWRTKQLLGINEDKKTNKGKANHRRKH